MKRARVVFLLSIVFFGACLEPYQVPKIDGGRQLLVVDAFLNTASPQSVEVQLSYTMPLGSLGPTQTEDFATVELRDSEGSSISLFNFGSGRYGLNGQFANPALKYKLYIATGQNIYESDLVTVRNSPPIDSISYVIEDGEMNINVNTHDPSGASRFYRWKYIETYEYQSAYTSAYIMAAGGPRPRVEGEFINHCWRSDTLQRIMVGTTQQLSEDVVTNFTLRKIRSGSILLSRKYSIIVQQQTLTEEAYNYWLNLQKMTEDLGGLFDPQPGQIMGNFHSISNPDEMVIGFFSAGATVEKRIFIDREDLPEEFDFHHAPCDLDTVLLADIHALNDPDALIGGIFTTDGLPVLIGFSTSIPSCRDCRRLASGQLERPPFWE